MYLLFPFMIFRTEKRFCPNQPCKNGGTCSETDDDFKCICPKGYLGETCEGRRQKKNQFVHFYRKKDFETFTMTITIY